jgi:hypothetical protein
LWRLDSTGTWASIGKVPGATTIARDGQRVVLAGADGIQVRELASPQTSRPATRIAWPSAMTQGPVSAIDMSDGGLFAMAVAGGDALTFLTVDATGKTGLLSPQPDSPFGPSLGWLDDGRLAVLSSDARQISRLSVVDKDRRTLTQLRGLGGVRAFAVSPDRTAVAAATETGVYVAPAATWLAGTAMPVAIAVPSGQIVWDLALDSAGGRAAMLSGAESADGTVSAIHELAYELSGGKWLKLLDVPVPFTSASGQVWLT